MYALRFRSAVLLCALLASAGAAAAQNGTSWNAARFHATRAELQEMLARYDQALGSEGYSAAIRERASHEASLIRQRLVEGDFRVGDQIALVVEGEPTLSDTLLVLPDLTARLPSGDTVDLRGVLRSEVQARLHERVARILKDPVVHAETFLRIAVFGAVGNQGFYVIRSDALLSDVFTRAGGIGNNAKLTDIHVQRDGKDIWEGTALQQALSEGRTLDQLSLRAGDQIVIPQQKVGSGQGWWRTVLFTIPPVLGLIRLVTR